MRKRGMDEAIRNRMRKALDEKGLDHRVVSREAGRNELYLYEALFRDGKKKGSLDGFQQVANVIGLNWQWLCDGSGEQWLDTPIARPLDREAVLTALEAILHNRSPNADPSDIRFLAATVLAIAESPPDGMSDIDTPSRIRSGIHGALLQFDRQLARENNE